VLSLGTKVDWYKNFAEVPEEAKKLMSKTMFCEPYTEANWNEGAEKTDPLNLRRCLRVYPQDHDVTGRFIAVFKKLKECNDVIYDDFYELDPIEDPRVKQHSLAAESRFMDKWMHELTLGEEDKAKEMARRDKLFPKFKRLVTVQPELWKALVFEFGIQSEFKGERLFYKSLKRIYYVDPAVTQYVDLRRGHRLQVD
jgi:hypothetical protein